MFVKIVIYSKFLQIFINLILTIEKGGNLICLDWNVFV